MSVLKVVYIAGPFRARTPWLVEQNVRVAEQVALGVWRNGMVALCPHTNTRQFDGVEGVRPELWLDGTMELMRRCDAVLMIEGWRTSGGAVLEKREADRLGMPVFENLGDLAEWKESENETE